MIPKVILRSLRSTSMCHLVGFPLLREGGREGRRERERVKIFRLNTTCMKQKTYYSNIKVIGKGNQQDEVTKF